ncbi:MAG: AAA family ATPase [Lachnospiraceae bacterium]|nr:AAA family ATPase [Lachnospiraceae bacterium]
MNSILIPDNLKDYLICEDCSDFNVNNYFKTARTEEIKEEIIRTKEKSDIIQNIIKKSYPNTTLLYGPAGTGKTTFSRYLAHELNMPFIYVNFAKIFSGIFGKTTSVINEIFEFVWDKECIFMLDEIDCISQERGRESDGATGGEISRVTITLMQCFDMLRSKKSPLILISATNRVDIMDKALRSRFSIVKEVPTLTSEEKNNFILKFLTDINEKLKENNMTTLRYNHQNIQDYCTRGSRISQRNVEMDIMRNLAKWLDNTNEEFLLDHIKEEL